MMTYTHFEEFWRGYLTALAFTATTEEGDSVFGSPGTSIDDTLDVEDFERSLGEDVHELREYAENFYGQLVDYFCHEDFDAEQAGSDFHLTRNRHGAGFWDSDWGEDGRALTDLAHPYGTCELLYNSAGEHMILS